MSTTIETAAQAATDNPDAVTAAVQSSHSAAAPTDPVEQRLAQIETFMTRWQPVFEMMETMVAAEVPSAAPIINRISQFETWAEQLLVHFQHKIPALPPAA